MTPALTHVTLIQHPTAFHYCFWEQHTKVDTIKHPLFAAYTLNKGSNGLPPIWCGSMLAILPRLLRYTRGCPVNPPRSPCPTHYWLLPPLPALPLALGCVGVFWTPKPLKKHPSRPPNFFRGIS